MLKKVSELVHEAYSRSSELNGFTGARLAEDFPLSSSDLGTNNSDLATRST